MEYGVVLKQQHEEELRSMLRKAFIRSAKNNFAPGEKCDDYFYDAFADGLNKMKEIGFEVEAYELRDYFIKEYWRRRNLTRALKKI